jgi:hypothetical protein
MKFCINICRYIAAKQVIQVIEVQKELLQFVAALKRINCNYLTSQLFVSETVTNCITFCTSIICMTSFCRYVADERGALTFIKVANTRLLLLIKVRAKRALTFAKVRDKSALTFAIVRALWFLLL